MNCQEIDYLAPLYWSGELDAAQRAQFEQHLQRCSACAHELEMQRQLDASIRSAVMSAGEESLPLAATVRERIEARHTSHPLFRWLAPAAAVTALLALIFAIRANIVQNPVSVASGGSPAILSDAADDHRDEVVDNSPRKWFRDRDAMFQLAAQTIGGPAVLDRLTPSGYRLDRTKICELAGRNYMHVVYTNGQHNISFFVRRQDGEHLTGPAQGSVGGTPLVGESFRDLKVTGFQVGQYTVVSVTDLPFDDALDCTRKAATSLAQATSRDLVQPIQKHPRKIAA